MPCALQRPAQPVLRDFMHVIHQGIRSGVGCWLCCMQVGSRSLSGAAGTYNHLTDALLDVPSVRAMYMRRLQTLADKYYGRGMLRQVSLPVHLIAAAVHLIIGCE